MFRRWKRASTRWNQGAASAEVKGDRVRIGAVAVTASGAAVAASGAVTAVALLRDILAAGGVQIYSGITSCK